MAWYYGTYSCGHEGRVNVVGKMSERQWKIDRHFEGICENCKAKQIEESNKKSMETSKEYEFPDLKGTEKQIAWANTIRLNFYEECEKRNIDINDIINNEAESKFWIDNRNCLNGKFIKEYHSQYEKKRVNELLVSLDSIKPDEIKHNGIVEIVKNNNRIVLQYEKNSDFIDLVKANKYQWDGTWYRNLTETIGDFSDRAAEIGNKLLKNGFCICIHDKDILKKAVDGKYKHEYTKWIYSRKDTTLLSIKWEGKSDNIYKDARKIKTSKWDWDTSSVIVDVSHYKEVEVFAEKNGFRFTNAAKIKIDGYIEQLNNIKEVEVK